MLHSKEETDEYNKAVIELNSSGKKFNLVNNSLNQARESAINFWNNAAQNYLERYIPKVN